MGKTNVDKKNVTNSTMMILKDSLGLRRVKTKPTNRREKGPPLPKIDTNVEK